MKLVARVGECEVWLVDLCAREEQYEAALGLLSDDERVRARAIRGEKARRRFVLARAALRVRLGHALAISPERVTLCSGEHGKPEIAPPPPGAEVGAARVSQGLPRFNLSHGDGAALLAINRRRDDVGVDIERIAPESERPWRKLMERICHPAEAREAMAEARTIGSRAFYERWVGKEAVLKALGLGLRVSPAEVLLRRDGAGVLRMGELPGRHGPARGGDLEEGRVEVSARARSGLGGCRLVAVPTPPGFVGAVALLKPARAS
jgi:4'-phosphopantetheinyl transferase